MLVFTTKGVLDRSLLTVEDIVMEEESSNVRVIACEWRLKSTGEMVRRDVLANVLVALDMSAKQEGS